MTTRRLIQTTLLLVLAASFTPSAAQAKDEPPNPVQQFLQGVRLGAGQFTEELVIFPLVAVEKPDRLGIQPSTWADKVGYYEPEFPRRRFDVGVANNSTQPLLLLGGTILGGGHRDRVVPSDVLVGVGAQVEIETIAAAPYADHRRTALPFRLGSALAPPYVRERAEYSPTDTLVPNFASYFLDFRNEGDERRSLSAINASTALNGLCIPCHQSLATFPTAQGGKVVGLITAVRGRIRSFEAFGDNRLFKAWFEPLLKSHTFAAAAIEARAKKLGLPLPGKDNPDATLAAMRAKAEKLLADLQKATYRDNEVPRHSVGNSRLLRTGNGTRGAAIVLGERLVHVAVFPYEPFEHALFASRLDRPREDDGGYGEDGEASLTRRARQGRLTEYEKRLLDRIRRNRSGRGLGPIRR